MSRNQKVLDSFIEYCHNHPTERFWQALRNWSKYNFIFAANNREHPHDTFYWENEYN